MAVHLNTGALAIADSDVESDEEYLQEEETEEDKKLNNFINAVRNGWGLASATTV